MANLVIFYDTETTDVWDFKADWNAPHQPNLIQLGYKVQDLQSRQTLFEVGHLIDTTPFESWKGISPGAQSAHGISEASLREWGTLPADAMHQLDHWARKCVLRVAHNESFDFQVVRGFAHRTGYSPEVFPPLARAYCTMKSTVNVCKVPAKSGYGYKWPKLDEAYRALVNQKGFRDAHNALADVNACADIFWTLVDSEVIKLGDLYTHDNASEVAVGPA